MMGIKNFKNGNKYLIYCEIGGKKGANKLRTLESQLIKYAALKGHELLNKKGVKIKYNKISFSGNRDSENMFGREMYIQS